MGASVVIIGWDEDELATRHIEVGRRPARVLSYSTVQYSIV